MKTHLLAIAGLLLCVSAQAGTVYTGARTVGSGTANLSITTDGTIGVLGTPNILDWTISMSDGLDSFTLLGPSSGNNSALLIDGTTLSATATNLIFDFSGSGFALFQSPSIGAGTLFYCVQSDGCFDFDGPAEGIDPRTDYNYVREARSGSVVLATAGGAATPEPATWSVAALGIAAIAARKFRARNQN